MARNSKKRGRRLTPEQRKKNKIAADHKRLIRTAFKNMGFERAPEIAGVEVRLGEQPGEFDDAFVYENVVILAEYTTSQSGDVTFHIKNKSLIFNAIVVDPRGAIAYLRRKIPAFDQRLGTNFHEDRYIIKIIYCSLHQYDENIKKVVRSVVYFDYPIVRYFATISAIIKMSALNELFSFLQIIPTAVAKNGVFQRGSPSDSYDGSILPESSSGFPRGYKVVSFYADAAALLSRAFVLRRDGWRGSSQAYQRMLIGSKIEAIRRKLKSDQRVFVNNVIATLPEDVQPETPRGRPVDISDLTNTEPVRIRLPARPNSIGLIDGQHRLFSYYEEKDDDAEIARLRHHQNLLVTGIIYPERTDSAERERFEAGLFLSINANQTNAPTPLRQEIEVFLDPFSPTAIGRQVMQRLAKTGPLVGHVEEFFWDKGKLKTSSIVSFGLGPLLKFNGDDTLFKLFSHPEKDKVPGGESPKALEAYLQFATTTINTFLGAVKANVDAERWTPDGSVKNRLIAVTYINSFLITLRLLVRNGKSIDFGTVSKSLAGLNSFPFKSYHSSQYARMAEKIYEKHFS